MPRHRGASAISWTLIEGDTTGGFSIFYPDEGLDTGDLLLTRQCNVSINDTVDSLYNNFMYPEGVKAMGEAVQMIAEDRAVCIKQPEVGATYDAFLNKPELCRVNLNQSAKKIHNFIRGLDSNPGAWAVVDGKETKLFNSRLWYGEVGAGAAVSLEAGAGDAVVTRDGLMIPGTDGQWLVVRLLSVEGKFVKVCIIFINDILIDILTQAHELGQQDDGDEELELTDDERNMVESVRKVWSGILKIGVEEDTDFFGAGAGSMDVVRLIEEVKEEAGVTLTNEEVFMATQFKDFSKTLVIISRGGGGKKAQGKMFFKKVIIRNEKMFRIQHYQDACQQDEHQLPIPTLH